MDNIPTWYSSSYVITHYTVVSYRGCSAPLIGIGEIRLRRPHCIGNANLLKQDNTKKEAVGGKAGLGSAAPIKRGAPFTSLRLTPTLSAISRGRQSLQGSAYTDHSVLSAHTTPAIHDEKPVFTFDNDFDGGSARSISSAGRIRDRRFIIAWDR